MVTMASGPGLPLGTSSGGGTGVLVNPSQVHPYLVRKTFIDDRCIPGKDQHCLYVVGGWLGYQWADFHCDFQVLNVYTFSF